MRVLIVGAGLSGLTLGAMLRRINIPAVVFEAAPTFEAVYQPPIVMWANGLSCMRAFGLDDVFANTAATDPAVPSDPFAFLHPVQRDQQGDAPEMVHAWSAFEERNFDEIPPEDFFGIRAAKGGKWLLKQPNEIVELPPMDEIDNIPSSCTPTATSNSVVSRTIINAHKVKLASVPLRVTLPAQAVKRSLMAHCAEVRFGRKVVAVQPSKSQFGGAVVRFDNGEQEWGDVVIGADGLHSAVRRLIYTEENQSTELESHNMLQVDGFARVQDFSPYLGVNPCEFWGQRRVLSYYPHIASRMANLAQPRTDGEKDGPKEDDGPQQPQQAPHIVSFSATLFDAPKGITIDGLRENLVEAQPALRELMATEFADFGPDVQQIFKEAALLRPAELLRVPLMPHWHHRRACLVGEAAHGSYPSYLMQDASLAVEDAAILATILATLPMYNDKGFEYGFSKFERARRHRIERYSRQSAQVRDMAQGGRRRGLPPVVRDAMLRAMPARGANRLLNWLSSWSYSGMHAEYDAESDIEDRPAS